MLASIGTTSMRSPQSAGSASTGASRSRQERHPARAAGAPGGLERRLSPRPRLGELLAVEDPEDAADEEQDHLVNGPGMGSAANVPPHRSGLGIWPPNHDLDGAERATDESAALRTRSISSPFVDARASMLGVMNVPKDAPTWLVELVRPHWGAPEWNAWEDYREKLAALGVPANRLKPIGPLAAPRTSRATSRASSRGFRYRSTGNDSEKGRSAARTR